MRLSDRILEKRIAEQVEILERDTRFSKTREFIQHGDSSVFVHCICVAYVSCTIMRFFNIKANITALILGALLHDYFLYDWHDGKLCRKVHGFTHPFKAYKNAVNDVELNPIEENIIKRHMFPLVPIPPRYIESWIVCVADKICATEETVNGHCSGKKMRLANRLLNRF